jgi:hypothetical protein
MRDKNMLASNAAIYGDRAQTQREIRRSSSGGNRKTSLVALILTGGRLQLEQLEIQTRAEEHEHRNGKWRAIEQTRHGLLELESGLLPRESASSLLWDSRSSL